MIQTGPGWGGPGYWGDASYPYPVVVEPACEVMDEHGRCAIFDANGRIIGFQGLGADDEASSMGSATTWISGGLIFGLAALMFYVDTKDPLGLKKSA